MHDPRALPSPPDCNVLRKELALCRYDVESSPLKLVPKKILPRSPNRSDVVAMLFWELPEPGVLCPPPEDNSDLLSPTRQRREREEYAGAHGMSEICGVVCNVK